MTETARQTPDIVYSLKKAKFTRKRHLVPSLVNWNTKMQKVILFTSGKRTQFLPKILKFVRARSTAILRIWGQEQQARSQTIVADVFEGSNY